MAPVGQTFRRPEGSAFRILSIDGGGIRGLIPALVLAHFEDLLRRRDPEATVARSFDLIAGTSTGGLIALGLTAPGSDSRPRMDAANMAELFRGAEARTIFTRPPIRDLPVVAELIDLGEPKYTAGPLRALLKRRFGDAVLGDALTPTMVSAYDMYAREPRFFKSWRDYAPKLAVVDAGVATAAAPTYFPPVDYGDGAALVDGGVFVNNPALAAVIEAVKHVDTGALRPHDTFVVSLGTGRFEPGFRQERVARWGQLGWVLPKKGEPPVVGAMLDGQSDAAHHWTHFMLNHVPGEVPSRGPEIGIGPRYFRFQAELPGGLPLDGVEAHQIRQLEQSARTLIELRGPELEAIANALANPSSQATTRA